MSNPEGADSSDFIDKMLMDFQHQINSGADMVFLLGLAKAITGLPRSQESNLLRALEHELFGKEDEEVLKSTGMFEVLKGKYEFLTATLQNISR